jgi:hypothetical protein
MTESSLNGESLVPLGDSSRADNVGVYEEITYSLIFESVDPELYIPAACIGRKASGPVGHHQIRGSVSG